MCGHTNTLLAKEARSLVAIRVGLGGLYYADKWLHMCLIIFTQLAQSVPCHLYDSWLRFMTNCKPHILAIYVTKIDSPKIFLRPQWRCLR